MLTTCVGRADDIAEITRRLVSSRPAGPAPLVTVTGPGGVGKTRTATEVATQFVPERGPTSRDVVWVDLRRISRAERVPGAIAAEAGLHDASTNDPLDALIERFVDTVEIRLLVLDNCEHLAGNELADTVAAVCEHTGVPVLATSRRALDVPGEQHWPLPPLEIDAALGMFVECARRVDPGFDINTHHDELIELVQRLATLPLLVEIAAAKVRFLTVPEILLRHSDLLSSDSALRSGGRTYRSSYEREIAVSWELLGHRERVLWPRLAVFGATGATLATITAVCGDDHLRPQDVSAAVETLLDHSLIQRTAHGGESRYWLLVPLADLAARRLADAGEDEVVRERHRAWVQHRFDHAVRAWLAPDEPRWMDQVRSDLPDADTALEWCRRTGRIAAGLSLALTVFRARAPFFTGELRQWGRHHLAALVAEWPHRDKLRASALAAQGYTAVCQGDEAAVALIATAEEIEHELGTELILVQAARGVQACFGATAGEWCVGQLERVRNLCLADPSTGSDVGMATMWWAIAAAVHGDDDAAEAATSAYLDEANATQAPFHRSWAHWARSVLLWRRGHDAEVMELLHTSLPVQRQVQDFWGPIWWCLLASWIAARQGQHIRSAELLGACDRVMTLTGIRVSALAALGEHHAATVRQVETALGEQRFAEAFTRGAALPDYAAAIRLVLGEITLDDATDSTLTERERDVALLVAKGMTNSAIAKELHLADTTVKTHLRHVFAKLGITQRTQVETALGRNEFR